eukprot:CAMPEP_0177487352 /NCGR_PEP_ID=MMETSP0369-20130122/29576_1 /TAXON_ID=447022 ORGANISM="Scrippsiella hangoei-like, Strain SHHI-4" /NCGR_SAMPLE_ID=MMETSP0369 /ASSEMBLY_ACC=CAM_ASM_000364 /LENGTH=179 /DNA_ID=CAMNT_0018963647 /DNA_START=17 /DNA_END=555 /DNA_ORIENTATION=+
MRACLHALNAHGHNRSVNDVAITALCAAAGPTVTRAPTSPRTRPNLAPSPKGPEASAATAAAEAAAGNTRARAGDSDGLLARPTAVVRPSPGSKLQNARNDVLRQVQVLAGGEAYHPPLLGWIDKGTGPPPRTGSFEAPSFCNRAPVAPCSSAAEADAANPMPAIATSARVHAFDWALA